jgi:hypothetical protein
MPHELVGDALELASFLHLRCVAGARGSHSGWSKVLSQLRCKHVLEYYDSFIEQVLLLSHHTLLGLEGFVQKWAPSC